MIRLDKKGKRITLISDTRLSGLKSTVPGAYETVSGVWTIPLNYESWRLLRQKYGKQLRLSLELRRWLVGVREARKAMSSLASATDAQLEVLEWKAPKLFEAMSARTYQRVGARFIADNNATLLADDPGLGKTLIALGGILEAEIPGPYLVVAPKTAAKPVWEREITRWLPAKFKAVAMPETRQARERVLKKVKFDRHTWLIVHPEMLLTQSWFRCDRCNKISKHTKRGQKILTCKHIKTRKTQSFITHSYPKLFDVAWGAIVSDESHETLIRRTGFPTQRRRGMELLKLRADGKRLAMSGTPMDSKPHNLWGTLNWLSPKAYSSFNRWAELYWQKTGYTGHEIGAFRKERERMLWDSLSTVCIRRTKAEVAKDLPPKIEVGTRLNPYDENSPNGIWLEMDGKQARAYEQMLEQSVAVLDSGRLEAISALAELTRLKQLASSYGDIEQRMLGDGSFKYRFVPTLPSNKFDWIVSTLEELGYPKDPLTKVVIVSFYTSLLNTVAVNLEKHFKTKPKARLTTAINGKTRDKAEVLSRFNSDDNEHIMMLNLKAGGTAITIDSADRMIFLTETRIPDQQLQAEDRIHRVSKPRQCMYYYLRSLGTVDVGTALANKELSLDTHRLLDQRRGVDYLRYVIDHSR